MTAGVTKRSLALVSALACAALLAGCGREGAPRTAVVISLTCLPSPPRTGPVSMRLTLRDTAGNLLPGAALELEGNMNHAGMRPVFASLKETQPGVHEGTLELTMGGDWFLLVSGTLPAGGRVDERVDLKGVAAR